MHRVTAGVYAFSTKELKSYRYKNNNKRGQSL